MVLVHLKVPAESNDRQLTKMFTKGVWFLFGGGSFPYALASIAGGAIPYLWSRRASWSYNLNMKEKKKSTLKSQKGTLYCQLSRAPRGGGHRKRETYIFNITRFSFLSLKEKAKCEYKLKTSFKRKTLNLSITYTHLSTMLTSVYSQSLPK